VKRKHYECVPHKLSEEEFWQRFFQSHYFHRDRISTLKDFFNDCAKQDEVDIQNAIKKGITDPFFDLRVFDDQVEPTIENVLGPNEMLPSKPELSANQALIRRFNYHSIMVLDACRSEEERGYPQNSLMSLIQSSEKKVKKETVTESKIETAQPELIEIDEDLEKERQQAKRRRILDATEYDDLSGKKPAVGAAINEFDEGVQPPRLKVTDVTRYMYGPTPSIEHDS